MFIGLTDELGSSTVMIEHATGELAERVMYQAYGATEQDARPTRWGSHREYSVPAREVDSAGGAQRS